MMIPAVVKTLDCSRTNGALALEVEGGDRVQARAVVVASGARYRRSAIADIFKPAECVNYFEACGYDTG